MSKTEICERELDTSNGAKISCGSVGQMNTYEVYVNVTILRTMEESTKSELAML